MEFNKEDINIGGSIFWILMVLLSLSGLAYLLIWSFHNDSVRGVVISVIFTTLIIAGILLSRMKIFDFYSWGDNALSFTLGFFAWLGLGRLFGTQSILSVSENHLFAAIAADLPQLVEVILNVFIIPIAEEIFWMIGIPFALISVMNELGKKYPLWKNLYLQMFVIIVVASVTFAIFHVGKMFIGFMIAAIVFRTIMIVLIYGEHKFDIIKGINLVVGFAIGAHIANNMISTGIQKTYLVLQTNTTVFIIVLVFFGVLFLSALNTILRFVLGKSKSLQSVEVRK